MKPAYTDTNDWTICVDDPNIPPIDRAQPTAFAPRTQCWEANVLPGAIWLRASKYPNFMLRIFWYILFRSRWRLVRIEKKP